MQFYIINLNKQNIYLIHYRSFYLIINIYYIQIKYYLNISIQYSLFILFYFQIETLNSDIIYDTKNYYDPKRKAYSKHHAYYRPTPQPLNTNQPIKLQIIDLDTRNNILLFGVTESGNSITVHIKNYIHSFYVGSDYVTTEEDITKKYKEYIDKINGQCKFEKVDMKTIYASQKQNKAYFKVSTNTIQNYIYLTKNIPMIQYNSDIDLKTRLFTDLESGCCQWIQINKFQISKGHQLSQYTIECNFSDIVALPDIHINSQIRVLSFDIECSNSVGFPDPENDKDQIITIGISCEFNQRQANVVFQLHQAAPLHNGHLVCFDTEQELIQAFIDYIIDFDPDIICGYNTDNFDFVYFLKRCKKLSIQPQFSRLEKFNVEFKDKTISSNQMGTREMNEIIMPGRVSVDLLLQIQATYKLRSYTLNNVCSEFLNQQKDDVYYDQITPMFYGTDLQRRTLAHYCLVDAQLCTKLNQKLQIVDNLVEMAKVTGITIHTLCKTGQQTRMISLLARYCKKENLLLPNRQRSGSIIRNEAKDEDDNEDLEGATVLTPQRGFYDQNDPISTLDFSSLYPSIMIAHNLCYSTLIKKESMDIQQFNEQYGTHFSSVEELQNNQEYCYKTPYGSYFLRKTIRLGLLPQILSSVLAERKKAKKQMNNAQDQLEKRVLNSKQLALKITANSLYGFTGAISTGKLPSIEISSSVTSIGREMIEQTKNLVETYYKPGDQIQCKDLDGNEVVVNITKKPMVVYGDTDSVMCRFFVSFKDAFPLAIHAAEMVTKTFEKPISLSFEKVYCPYLLINKKRYAGLYFTRPEKYDKIDVKGLELVRRDNCKLVQIAMKEVLHRLLVDGNKESAIKYMQQVSTELSAQRIDINLLVISKSYSQKLEDYKNQNQPHLIVMQKLRQRGQTVKIGDRIPYIVIQNQYTKLYEKVEDPQYFIQNALQLDTDYYMTNQLRSPIERLFDQVIPDTNVLFKSEFIASKEHSNIFQSKKSHCCIVCGKRSDIYVICDQCRGYQMNKAIIAKQENQHVILPVSKCITQKYSMLIHELQLAEYRSCQIQHQCITCQEMEDFTQQCSNKDCELYYARYKQSVEVRRLRQRINEFGYDTWEQIEQRKAEVKAKRLQQQQ